jgi:hypothetical protein
MKTNIIRNLLLITILTAASTSFALEIHCPSQSDTDLSALFANHWEWNAAQSNYFSYVEASVVEQRFAGALHTLNSNKPQDLNPHLHFSHIDVRLIKHYDVWNINCLYTIANPEMVDADNNYLAMTTTVPYPEYKKCKVENDRVICQRR